MDSRIEELISAVFDASDPAVREEAVRALGALGEQLSSPRILEAFRRALADTDWGTRQSAAEMLMRLKADRDSRAEKLLLADLQSEDAEIRLGAAWSLVEVGDGRARDVLKALTSHSDERIRAAAEEALHRLEGNETG